MSQSFETNGFKITGLDERQRAIIEGRDKFINEYCAERGWKKEELTWEQVMEIRQQPGWREPVGLPKPSPLKSASYDRHTIVGNLNANIEGFMQQTLIAVRQQNAAEELATIQAAMLCFVSAIFDAMGVDPMRQLPPLEQFEPILNKYIKELVAPGQAGYCVALNDELRRRTNPNAN